MPIRDLRTQLTNGTARNVGGVPKRLALLPALLFLLVSTILTVACKDSPGFSSEELVSDPLPEFSDSAIAGEWLSEGELIIFEAKEHGVYVAGPADKDEEGDSDKLTFKLKRIGSLLFMEYSEENHGERYFRPCWIGLDEEAFEFHCLKADELPELGVQMQNRKGDDFEFEFISDTQEHLRQVYLEQANNRRVFEPTLRLTRPQPARVARARKQAVVGNPEAQERLARYLLAGEIVERDRDGAKEWACKAASSGRASSQVLCGDFIQEESRFKDPSAVPDLQSEARSWYQSAAEQQFPLAYSKLGRLFESEVLADDSAAVASYQRGAELGDPDSHAQLGIRYLQGKGVPEDAHRAQQHLEMVPETDRTREVWASLAEIYLHAIDPEQRDKKKALYAAEKAVEDCGDPDLNRLAAEAAFENGKYLAAVSYQKQALWEGHEDNAERVAKLETYRSFALLGQ